MTGLVSIYIAADITEADEVQGLLAAAGITSQLEAADEDGPPPGTGDSPCRVLVAVGDQHAALDVLRTDAAEADGEQW
jgi:hypothetical protein